MHYLIKESADEMCKAQLAFMKKQLWELPLYRADREKLREVKKEKGCEALPPRRRAARLRPKAENAALLKKPRAARR
jgi:hypothetical protein